LSDVSPVNIIVVDFVLRPCVTGDLEISKTIVANGHGRANSLPVRVSVGANKNYATEIDR